MKNNFSEILFQNYYFLFFFNLNKKYSISYYYLKKKPYRFTTILVVFFLVQVLRLSTPGAMNSRNCLNSHFLVMTRTLPDRLKNLSIVFFVTLLVTLLVVTPAAIATKETITFLSLTNRPPAFTAKRCNTVTAPVF